SHPSLPDALPILDLLPLSLYIATGVKIRLRFASPARGWGPIPVLSDAVPEHTLPSSKSAIRMPLFCRCRFVRFPIHHDLRVLEEWPFPEWEWAYYTRLL